MEFYQVTDVYATFQEVGVLLSRPVKGHFLLPDTLMPGLNCAEAGTSYTQIIQLNFILCEQRNLKEVKLDKEMHLLSEIINPRTPPSFLHRGEIKKTSIISTLVMCTLKLYIQGVLHPI